MEYTMEQAILEGVREFDFLRGDEPYKSAWGAQPEISSRMILWHNGPPMDLLTATQLKPSAHKPGA